MADSLTETRIQILRDDVRALSATTSELQRKLDAHIREADEERRKREHARDIRLWVLIGILGLLNFVSILLPVD